jgi:2'-5' RNA ligase
MGHFFTSNRSAVKLISCAEDSGHEAGMTSSQMSMFDDGAHPSVAPTDVLFFALQPDATAASAIADLAARLRSRYGLKGKLQSPERLHVTLYFMGNFRGVPQEIVDRACNALAAFRAPSFEVCFDRVMSFRRKSNRPVVLVGGELLTPLQQFQSQLSTALVRAHLPDPEKMTFTPHVTLLRDDREVPEQGVNPVRWTAREFVLVHSLFGRGQHRVLARFPLL